MFHLIEIDRCPAIVEGIAWVGGGGGSWFYYSMILTNSPNQTLIVPVHSTIVAVGIMIFELLHAGAVLLCIECGTSPLSVFFDFDGGDQAC